MKTFEQYNKDKPLYKKGDFKPGDKVLIDIKEKGKLEEDFFNAVNGKWFTFKKEFYDDFVPEETIENNPKLKFFIEYKTVARHITKEEWEESGLDDSVELGLL